jgi:hypothetical protein
MDFHSIERTNQDPLSKYGSKSISVQVGREEEIIKAPDSLLPSEKSMVVMPPYFVESSKWVISNQKEKPTRTSPDPSKGPRVANVVSKVSPVTLLLLRQRETSKCAQRIPTVSHKT